MNAQQAAQAKRSRKTMEHLTNVMTDMHNRMERKSREGDLQIIKHLVKAMETVTASLSLPNAGSAPLLLGLSIAFNGINKADSSAGIIGPCISRLMEALSDGFISKVMPEADRGKRKLLTLSTTACFILLACFASQISREGIGTFSKDMDSTDLKRARFFGFELVLMLLSSSGTLNEVFREIIQACGGGEKAQRIGSPLLASIGSLLMVLAGAQEGEQKASIVGDHEKYFRKGIAAADAAANSGFGALDESTAAVAVAIQRLQNVLEEKKYEEFIEALNGLLEGLGTSHEALLADMKDIRKTARTLMHILSQEYEEPLTGVIRIA